MTDIHELDQGERIITVLYFSALVERLGLDAETITLPEEVRTLEDLIPWLMTRRGEWQKALAGNLIISINSCFVDLKQKISDKDEISIVLRADENIC